MLTVHRLKRQKVITYGDSTGSHCGLTSVVDSARINNFLKILFILLSTKSQVQTDMCALINYRYNTNTSQFLTVRNRQDILLNPTSNITKR